MDWYKWPGVMEAAIYRTDKLDEGDRSETGHGFTSTLERGFAGCSAAGHPAGLTS